MTSVAGVGYWQEPTHRIDHCTKVQLYLLQPRADLFQLATEPLLRRLELKVLLDGGGKHPSNQHYDNTDLQPDV
ncbi:MAG: hypothetical protein ACRDRO_05155 [Pseudonocardiaceae bacterium]